MHKMNHTISLTRIQGENEASAIQDVAMEAMEKLAEESKAWSRMGERDAIKFALTSLEAEITTKLFEPLEKRPKITEDQVNRMMEMSLLASHETAFQTLGDALRFAPTTKHVALVHLQRAKLNMSIGKFGRGLPDLNSAANILLAKSGEKDDDVLYQIYHKKAQCALKVGLKQDTLEALELARKHLKAAKNVCSKSKEKFDSILADSIKRITSKAATKTVHQESKEEEEVRQQFPGFEPHTEIKELSNQVKMVRSLAQGRYLVAESDIKVGSLVIMERSNVWLLNPDDPNDVLRYCQHCLSPCSTNFHPCFDCTDVVFCSESCRSEAAYHKYECECSLYRFRATDVADSFRIFLTLRTLFMKPLAEHDFGERSVKFCMFSVSTFTTKLQVAPDEHGDAQGQL